MLKEGTQAPDFSAETTAGSPISLQGLRGRWVVLYFFPKAFTTGCSIETRRFQQILPELRSRNAEVIGVSGDKFDRQCDFARHLDLSFPLIADTDGAIAKQYGAKRPFLPLDRRITYIIDPEGRIAAAFHHEFAVNKHGQNVREFLDERLGPAPAAAPAE